MLLKKERNVLYMSDTENNSIYSVVKHYYTDTTFATGVMKKKDTFLQVDNSDPSIYDCFSRFYNEVMEKYEKEEEWKKRLHYEKIGFINKYNHQITFYSDKCPILESNSFVITKCKREDGTEFFEIAFYFNKHSINASIQLTNDYGYYDDYIPFLVSLQKELLNLATEIEKPKPDEMNPMTEDPVDIEDKTIKGFIKRLFKREKK